MMPNKMIEELEIVNFKSIKNLRLKCKRVNLLIGEPNIGKSNILEALGLLSFCAFPTDFQKFVRFEDMSHLFYPSDRWRSLWRFRGMERR